MVLEEDDVDNMTDYVTIAAWIILIIGFCAFGIFGFFGIWRKMKAYVIVVKKDYRNPDRGEQKFYGVVDKPDKSIKYYNNLFTPNFVRKVPLYDLSAWSQMKKVTVVRGVTGKPGDDMDVPIGLALNSQAAANDYAKMVSDSVTHIIPFYDECKRIDLRVGEMGVVTVKKKGEEEKIRGFIKQINYQGVIFEYQLGDKTKQLILDEDNVSEFKSTMPKEDKLKLTPLGYSNFFTEMWAMQKFGIRRVEDANVMTIPAKQSIANFINGNNEFVAQGQGFLERNFMKIFALAFLMIMALSVYFIINGNLQWNAGVTAQLISTHDAVCGSTTTAPTAGQLTGTTTVSPTNIGGVNITT